MKALILASGIGSRLQPLTNKKPKTLTVVTDNETILDRILDSLLENKIYDVVITTGYLDYVLVKHITDSPKYKDLRISYVRNPIYAKTNYIYSIWLARELLHDDILLVHADLVFSPGIVKKLLRAKTSVATVRKMKEPPHKDFIAGIENGLIKKIGVGIEHPNTRTFMPFYKLLKRDWELWMKKMESYMKEKDKKVYAEHAFNEISNKIKLYPIYYQEEVCMEIDTLEDLDKAKKLLKATPAKKPLAKKKPLKKSKKA